MILKEKLNYLLATLFDWIAIAILNNIWTNYLDTEPDPINFIPLVKGRRTKHKPDNKPDKLN